MLRHAHCLPVAVRRLHYSRNHRGAPPGKRHFLDLSQVAPTLDIMSQEPTYPPCPICHTPVAAMVTIQEPADPPRVSPTGVVDAFDERAELQPCGHTLTSFERDDWLG
jgi:hypothetical protein